MHDWAWHVRIDPSSWSDQSPRDGFRRSPGSEQAEMSSPTTAPPDSASFQALIEPYRSELHAHCYRMLGSSHDADDALQDALLRAWRGMPRFEGRSSMRTWLYRIATNSCLRLIERRPRRVLPIDYGAPADPHDRPAAPLVESVWIEPYPDAAVADGLAAPDARYEQRESVELAFVAALQHLPARQRAVLILRDVLGFSGAEVAEALQTTPKAVYSALQRAHRTIDERLPEHGQQQTLRALGDARVRELVERYVDAWEAVARRSRLTHANGQLAVASTYRPGDGPPLDVLQLLTLDGDGRIAEITAFIGVELAPFGVRPAS
jgi:RNA polymerase sigma-70 factor (TIGR02960 family)